jgi:predicted DsbA family dithiol-disulfide isomerase
MERVQPAKAENKSSDNKHALADPPVDITIYTDPLCCWSWAFEPELAQIKTTLSSGATWQYRMGGLIPTWKNFHDEVNSVSRPVQMGPVWMHAGQVTNRPIYHQIWMKDPPASSYPSCIAVKSVQLQSAEAANYYLLLLREACMGNGENIARETVLYRIAATISDSYKNFDFGKFKSDYEGEAAKEAFREDLDLVRKYNINRFPTLIIKAGGNAIMISGYRPHQEILAAIQHIAPNTSLPFD